MIPFVRFEIQGRSMAPAFEPGDRVLVWKWGSVREGDVVVFAKGGRTIVKRAVCREGDRWVMRGDNASESTDSFDFGPVRNKAVIGKVVTKY